jgi:hypothetical protein
LKDSKPNLSSDFNVPGLRPIIKENFDEEQWILRDEMGVYYTWYEWEGRLMRITNNWVKGPELKTVDDIT